MKKPCVLLACLLLAGALCGCGEDAPETPAPTPAPESQTATPAPSPTATPSPTPEPAWVIPSPEEDLWAYQAYTLTCQITEYCLEPFEGTLDTDTLNDTEILNFLWSANQYCKDANYPYAGDITIDSPPDGSCCYARLPEESAQKIVYQLFGVADWSGHDTAFYDAAVPEYRFDMLQPGPRQNFSCRYISASRSGDTVTVPFHLYGTQTVVDTTGSHEKEYGGYTATYRVMTEDGQSFLRFAGLHPEA